MKNDYLWDKTGSDAEIEKLENALQVFRIQETKAPLIPNNIVSFKKETPRKIFPIFRALAAGFASVFIWIGISLFYFNFQTETSRHNLIYDPIQNEVSKIQQSNYPIQPKTLGIKETADGENSVNEFEKSKTENKKIKVQKLIYKPKEKAPKVQQTEGVKLTEEEKVAYDKLMLALSISSSKLKIVKDKVQNLDEQTAINTENKKYTRKK